jgi:hypothetical protein
MERGSGGLSGSKQIDPQKFAKSAQSAFYFHLP